MDIPFSLAPPPKVSFCFWHSAVNNMTNLAIYRTYTSYQLMFTGKCLEEILFPSDLSLLFSLSLVFIL